MQWGNSHWLCNWTPDVGKVSGFNTVALSPFPSFPQLRPPLWVSFIPRLVSLLWRNGYSTLGFPSVTMSRRRKNIIFGSVLLRAGTLLSQQPPLETPPTSPPSPLPSLSHMDQPLGPRECPVLTGLGFLNQSLAGGMGLQWDAPKKYKGFVRRRKRNWLWVGIYNIRHMRNMPFQMERYLRRRGQVATIIVDQIDTHQKLGFAKENLRGGVLGKKRLI